MNEKINPRQQANFVSLLFFGYILKLLRKGYKKDLQEEDLYGVKKSCRSKICGDQTEKQWVKSRSIYKLLWTRFGTEYLTLCLATILWTQVNSIGQPYGQSKLISYFEQRQTSVTRTEAYYSAAIVIVLKVVSVFFRRHVAIYRFYLSIKIRASLRSLLYRKALKLSLAAFSGTNLGNILTILTKDIDIVETNLWIMAEFVIVALQTCTIGYLLWNKMGNVAFVGIGLLLLVLPLEVYITSLLIKIRLRVGKYTDARLLVTQETLSAIKIIKMYCWEKFFNEKISETRKKEVIIMVKGLNLRNALLALTWLSSSLNFLTLNLSYLWMGYTASTEMIFYVLALYFELREIYGAILPMNIFKGAEIIASMMRLNQYLHAVEIFKNGEELNGRPLIKLENVAVKIKDTSVLKNVCLKIDTPGLFLITGPVGSGKSTLLKAILKECSHEGNIQICGTVSYASQEPWLFPASVKDNILFGQKCNSKRYQEVIRVCALEYDFSLLECGDETLVADSGINLSKGQQARVNLARAIYKDSDIYLLDDCLTALDIRVQNFIFNECICKFLSGKICILVTQSTSHLNNAERAITLQSGHAVLHSKDSKTVKSLSDAVNNTSNLIGTINTTTEDSHVENKIYRESKKEGKVEFTVYKKYFEFGGGLILFSAIIILYVLGQFAESYTEQLLTEWVDLQQIVLDLSSNSTNNIYYSNKVLEKDTTLNWYIMMTVLGSLLWLTKFYIFLLFCRRASIKIHRVMSYHIVNGTMSFFDTHLLGNILNRFSYDLFNIDEYLPQVLPELMNNIFFCSGSLILLIKVNWIFLLPSIVFIVGLILIRMGYIPTGRSLKRLEAATRSPLVGHINSSLKGLTTIRAFEAQQNLKDQFDANQDRYSSAYFTLVCTMTAFEFFVDVLCTIFLIIVVIRFVIFDHDLSAGNVGLALTQVFALTSFIPFGMRLWTDTETYMACAERMLEYTGIKTENVSGTAIDNWPQMGGIIFDKVSLTYENRSRPVLKDISFSVKSCEKIGIVGRTGAGKSSITSILFGLYEYQGKILIDGVDSKELGLNLLRNSIAIIPQDPILFNGTIRSNIDPNNLYSDEEIWNAIEKVKVKHLIPSLDLPVTEGGALFSMGQKQLLCLARVAVRKYKIVVFDEPTANMDSKTDDMLHEVIREIFAGCTVLMIAHRLSSILNYDKVMVLEKGEIVEYDTPSNLLENRSSEFYSMCKESEVFH